MKDILLKIVGQQEDDDADKIELITEGRLYKKKDSTYLIYDESEFTGFPGCKTSFKLTGNTLKMKRMGKEVESGTEIVFSKGKRFTGKYETPFGEVNMEVFVNDVINNMSDDGGEVFVDYNVSLGGLEEGRNKLTIEVTS